MDHLSASRKEAQALKHISTGDVNNVSCWCAGENLTDRSCKITKCVKRDGEAAGHLFYSFCGDFPWVDCCEKSHASYNDRAS